MGVLAVASDSMRLYRGLYGVLGSYELMRMKWDLDVGSYYNMWVSAYMRDMHLDETFLEQQLSWQPFLLQGLTNFARLFQAVESHLVANGTFHRSNLGLCVDSYHAIANQDLGLFMVLRPNPRAR